MIQTGLLAFMCVWIVAASIARFRENSKMRKIAEPLVKAQEDSLAGLVRDISTIKELTIDSTAFLKEVMGEDLPVLPNASRVYAAILRSGVGLRLHMLPALTLDEFHEKSKAIVGPHWHADVVEYLDVYPTAVERAEVVPTKVQKKEMGIEQGLHFLMYARDSFAEGVQRDAMEGIISNYKRRYELS